MFLALVGIFGLVAYSVVQRTREIGLRMALGARKSEIQRLVVGQAMRPLAIGLIIGVVGALALSRFMASFLYELTATDPMTYAVAICALTLAALAASVVPARRATRIDPMVALRCE
jgi:putative ABC transport system permease protein